MLGLSIKTKSAHADLYINTCRHRHSLLSSYNTQESELLRACCSDNDTLVKLVKVILCLAQCNADLKKSISKNKKLLTNNRSLLSFSFINVSRTVKEMWCQKMKLLKIRLSKRQEC